MPFQSQCGGMGLSKSVSDEPCPLVLCSNEKGIQRKGESLDKKLNWKAWLQNFHNLGGICTAPKNRVKALSSVMTMLGCLTLQMMCPSSSNAKSMAKSSLAFIVKDNCPAVNQRNQKRKVHTFFMKLCFLLLNVQIAARSPHPVRRRRTILRVVGRLMGAVTKLWVLWRYFCSFQKYHLCGFFSFGILCPSVTTGAAGYVFFG